VGGERLFGAALSSRVNCRCEPVVGWEAGNMGQWGQHRAESMGSTKDGSMGSTKGRVNMVCSETPCQHKER